MTICPLAFLLTLMGSKSRLCRRLLPLYFVSLEPYMNNFYYLDSMVNSVYRISICGGCCHYLLTFPRSHQAHATRKPNRT